MKGPKFRWLAGMWVAFFSAAALAQNLEASKASVVKIISQSEAGRRTGTGFIVKADGDDVYLVTASHVVEGDSSPQVYFLTRRNKPVKAQVLKLEGGDPRGMALLLVHGKENLPSGLQSLAFSQAAALHGGQDAIAIGFGAGQGDWAVIRCSVTAIDGRDVKLEGRIEEGNSGGPLLKDGQVVGLITGVKQGFGIATPALFVEATLKGWGVDIARSSSDHTQEVTEEERRPTEVRAGDRYALHLKQIKAGRKSREQSQFDLRNGVMAINLTGQMISGKVAISQQQVIDEEILEVTGGRPTKAQLSFPTITVSYTRELAGEKETENKTNPLQGKSVVATRSGLSWEFKSGVGSLSPAEVNELQSYVPLEDEGFPKDAVAVGHQWEVTGQQLRNFLKLGDFAASDGKASMTLERVVTCGNDQCAEIGMQLSVSGLMMDDEGMQRVIWLEGTGRILRVLASDINREVEFTGQMGMKGGGVIQQVPVEVTITGPFTFFMRTTVK